MQKNQKAILQKIIFVIPLLGLSPLFAGVGTEIGLWEPLTGFLITLKYFNIASISALVFFFLIMNFIIKDMKQAILTYVAALIFAGAGYYLGIHKEPPDTTGVRGIHDVTTDMENPPQFLALLDAAGRNNSFDYPIETSERQKAKFPWVKPLLTDMSPQNAYNRALEIATEMGWHVVGKSPQLGRFEATEYTKWFNFRDDIVVRITPQDAGSRIDLRSLTRAGSSDHGLGAARIMNFQKKFAVE